MSDALTRRKAIVFGLTLTGAALLAEAARPRRREPALGRHALEAMFPHRVGDWRADGTAHGLVQPADEQGRIYGLYDQVLERAYVNARGERVMLSVAYGAEQSPALQVHRPEICYSAVGFDIGPVEEHALDVGAHLIPVSRLHAAKIGRSEPVTYWTVLGGAAVSSRGDFRWRQIASGLRGEVHDGMLVRVSSLSRDAEPGYRLHARFVAELFRAIAPQHRDRVFGRAPRQR